VQPIRIGIVGVGKIARDQHIPSIGANPAYSLVAAASRNAQLPGVANFQSIEELLRGVPDLDAVALCTPPQTHYAAAKLALAQGKHVLLEKPPCTSIAQLENLVRLAAIFDRTLYQTWHSQHAAGVAPAARLLRERKLLKAQVTWKEDVRQWHPGQSWLWQAGGFGVLDPGINALSILTRLIPEPIFPTAARLYVPANCDAPIAADIELVCDSGVPISVTLDFRHSGVQTWDIDLQTDAGPMKLAAGGGLLRVADRPVRDDGGVLESEYQAIYRHFATLISRRQTDVDARPLALVADIFMAASHIAVEPFTE
jgi:D-galactose 1-dehydrogenase